MDTRDVNVAIKALKDGKRVGKNGMPHLYCVLGDDGSIYLYKKERKNKWSKKMLFNSLKDYELAYKKGHLFNIWEEEK
jgi:hypothetical protein